MPRQPELLSTSELRIVPPHGSTEPRLWIRRLVLWREPGDVLRDIKLRPGLNIVWSPDSGEEAKRATKQTMGHGSGKTLLCRLLRYCLGEDRFAPDEQRDSIALSFPNGAVGAEILVDGTVWAVLRPIGMGRKHYAIADGDLEKMVHGEVEATGIDPFLAAVESGIISADVASLVPGEKQYRGWLVALAWLARDQECRFDKVLDWRSSDSESRSPVRSLSVQKTLEALRTLIGAITPDECRLRDEIALLEHKQKESGQDISHSRWEVRKAKSTLISRLGLRHEEVPSGRLVVDVLRNAAKEGLARVATVSATTDVADVGKLRATYETANNRVEALANDLAVIEAQIPEVERLLGMMKGELPGLSVSIHKAENPHCPICEVPIDIALAEGCQLSHKLPNLEEVRARRENLKQEIEKETVRLQNLQERKVAIDIELPGVREYVNELKGQIQAIDDAREKRAEAWYSARRLLDDVKHLDDLLDELDRSLASADKLHESIDDKKERTSAFRKAQTNVFHKLSHHFDAIIRYVAGDGAEGKVTLDGNGLHLSVKLGGERSTPAITSLKVIAFDLAVLCMSMEGRTHIPPFLIHDSPREADLGLSIYHQLFYFVQELEQIGGQPLFQYIVTTTTRPPEEMLVEPWLRETLRGSPSAERLMRQDL